MHTKTIRNWDKRTEAATVEANIVAHMRKWRCDSRNPLNAARIGEAGFPDYSFQRPQGAAFAVSRILRGMVSRGVLKHNLAGHGFYLAELG
jgi:hypothetical protein